MVNNNVSTKYAILNILRNTKGSVVSGQMLAGELGVSRVSIWKAVQSLQESGYGIAAQGKGSSAGYALLKDEADSLYPWEFAELQAQFKHFKSTTSTMDEARILAVQNSKVSIVTADEQTKGRGRLDHEWVSTPQSLSFTLITRPAASLGSYNRLCALAQVALVHVFEKISGKKYFVRWPNDIWSQEGKVAGILTDVQGTGDSITWVNLGIGINTVTIPRIEKTDALFFHSASNQVPRRTILLDFLKEVKKLEKETAENPDLLVKLWNGSCPDVGQKMQIKGSSGHRTFNGINTWAWAQCDDGCFPPGDIRFSK